MIKKEYLITKAQDILVRVFQKDIGFGTMVDVVNNEDEKALTDWNSQLELYLLNVKKPQVIKTIESYLPVQNGDRVRKKHLQAIIDVLNNYNEV